MKKKNNMTYETKTYEKKKKLYGTLPRGNNLLQ